MDLLRNPEDLHLNTVSLKASGKRKNVPAVNLRDTLCEMGLTSSVIRVTNLRTCIFYYPSQHNDSTLFKKIMLRMH